MKKIIIPVFLVFFSLAGRGMERPDAANMERSPDSLRRIKKLKVKSLSDLSRLSPFRDVAVIQRRYLPKTFRGEAGASLNGLLNNRFFYSGGLSSRLGFFVREQFGFGALGMAFWRVSRAVTRDLKNTNNIVPFTNVESRYYGGGYLKWNPVYGKFAFSFLESRIVYFDMFFLAGFGMIYLKKGTDAETERLLAGARLDEEQVNQNVYFAPVKSWWPAGLAGFGQTFAMSKNWGVTWNLQWIIYHFKASHTKDGRTISRNNTDIHLSVGVNYYFPGVKYR